MQLVSKFIYVFTKVRKFVKIEILYQKSHYFVLMQTFAIAYRPCDGQVSYTSATPTHIDWWKHWTGVHGMYVY